MSKYLLYTAPILAGTQANWALMAMLAIQVYTFHTRFPNERRWIKLLVYTVFPLELAQTGVSSHYAYWLLALGWGDTTMLGILPWSCFATPIFVSITAALVQIFFAWSGYYLPVEAKKLDPLKAYSCRRIYLLMLKTVWARVLTAVIILFADTTAFANMMRFVVGAKVNYPSFFDLPIGVHKSTRASTRCRDGNGRRFDGRFLYFQTSDGTARSTGRPLTNHPGTTGEEHLRNVPNRDEIDGGAVPGAKLDLPLASKEMGTVGYVKSGAVFQRKVIEAWLMIAAVCDVLITTTLIIIFFQYRLQMPSEERRADTFMVKLMLNTVETGAVTSVAALISLVLFLLYPGYNLAEAPTFILGKLYANVLLFTLNARAGGARRRFWTTEPQHGVGMFTSVYTTYATHAASDCFDSP
ncbi:hypothetical protein B0H19DRAFT_1241327 [Mycena capillaripes]|nr:hypothetical protein B0H19DRAFT_1241327 [Mycena capillaripes]